MAYNNSGMLNMGSTYKLGEYSIRCYYTTEEGQRYVIAHISGPEGSGQNGIVINAGELDGWYCEANEYEATIYVHSKGTEGSINAVRVICNIKTERDPGYRGNVILGNIPTDLGYETTIYKPEPGIDYITKYNGELFGLNESGHRNCDFAVHRLDGDWQYQGGSSGQTGYPTFSHISWEGLWNLVPESDINPAGHTIYDIYVAPGEYMVARFTISLIEAGGGPAGSDPSWESDVPIWDEPGDVDYDREPDEPTKTLYLTSTGSLSGRHNDPLEDTSFSYLPSDKNTHKSDGNGGDGGNGGGGGAGASTVIVRDFATGKADSHISKAYPKRHGYGSSGGKGGRGGDGCIFVYW